MKSSQTGGGGTAQYGRRALAVLLGLLSGLAFAELAFRIRDHGAFPHLNVYKSDPAYGVRLRPGAVTQIAFGGAQVSSVFIHAGGFRGTTAGAEPPPAKGEVLFVGDSQTFGLGVEASQAFPARFAELAQLPAYNAGVPTWGPPEFLRALKELGQRQHPATIVYVVNFANDPFEAERPNAERHLVWDGWAVRRETAPAQVSQFPGRELLFQRSHLMFAFRQWWYRRSAAPAQDTERGNPSEGTFRDLFVLGRSFSNEQAAARKETERRAQLYESEATYAQEGYRLAESKVRALVWEQLKLGSGYAGLDAGAPGSVYLAADANPGDIVLPGVGEEGRAVYATALYIRQAVELRNRFEAELARRASSALSQDEAKQVLAALSARDQERLKLAAVRAQPLELVRATSPLTHQVLQAKLAAEALGARFVLLVLPIDVMVSNAEWPKHSKSKVDLAPAGVLIQDLVESVREAGGIALDASAALAAAEPGAFLPTDIHLTPKGHDAVARALLRAMRESTPSATAPRLALEPGRSRVPPPEAWDALGGEAAVTGSGGCPITKKKPGVAVRSLLPGERESAARRRSAGAQRRAGRRHHLAARRQHGARCAHSVGHEARSSVQLVGRHQQAAACHLGCQGQRARHGDDTRKRPERAGPGRRAGRRSRVRLLPKRAPGRCLQRADRQRRHHVRRYLSRRLRAAPGLRPR